MNRSSQYRQANRLLVIMPTWVGDAVMATPTLRALRNLYPTAHITALTRRSNRPLLDACPWIDGILSAWPPQIKIQRDGAQGGVFGVVRRLAAGQFDTAVLLPNGIRSALTTMLAGIPRRVGYDRNGRGFLLTDRLAPRRQLGAFVPVPTLDYYLAIVRYLGAEHIDRTMRLFTRPEDDQRAEDLLVDAGWSRQVPLVVINPGASFGDAKLWPIERFAAVSDRCVNELGAFVAIGGASKERPLLQKVIDRASRPIFDLPGHGVDMKVFKSVVRKASVVICNDTGARHMATALGTPAVSVFGPTDPAWTETGVAVDRQVRVDVDCGPCQLRKCPLDHRCMTRIKPQMVFDHVGELVGWNDELKHKGQDQDNSVARSAGYS